MSSLVEKIYHTANNNMQLFNIKLSYNLLVFRRIINKNPRVIDVSEFDGLEMEDFVTLAYYRCLNRLPDQVIKYRMSSLKDKYLTHPEIVHFKLLLALNSSPELKQLDKQITGMKELKKTIFKKYLLRGWLEVVPAEAKGIVRKSVLNYFVFPLWKALPNGGKNVIRGLLGREKRYDDIH